MRLIAPLLACLAIPPAAAATPAGLGPIPPVPARPPAPAVIPAPDLAPPHPTAPPAPAPVHKDAPGDPSTIARGTRVTFGSGRADLNPATAAALDTLAGPARDRPDVTFTVTAYAPGSAEDVSSPRRLSLERALAVRSMLIHAGINSARIYVHALGIAPAGRDPPDRVDVILGTIGERTLATANPAAR